MCGYLNSRLCGGAQVHLNAYYWRRFGPGHLHIRFLLPDSSLNTPLTFLDACRHSLHADKVKQRLKLEQRVGAYYLWLLLKDIENFPSSCLTARRNPPSSVWLRPARKVTYRRRGNAVRRCNITHRGLSDLEKQ